MKWVELLKHCILVNQKVDRKVCICGFILNDISQVVRNILDTNPTIDLSQLKTHFRSNISGYDFLMPADTPTAQFWVNMQNGYGDYYPYTDMVSRPIKISDSSCYFLNSADVPASLLLVDTRSGFSYINVNIEGTNEEVEEVECVDFTSDSFNYAILKASKVL